MRTQKRLIDSTALRVLWQKFFAKPALTNFAVVGFASLGYGRAMSKTQRTLLLQRRELLSDWVCTRKAETLRARHVAAQKQPVQTSAPAPRAKRVSR
jgi:hypothetical protein